MRGSRGWCTWLVEAHSSASTPATPSSRVPSGSTAIVWRRPSLARTGEATPRDRHLEGCHVEQPTNRRPANGAAPGRRAEPEPAVDAATVLLVREPAPGSIEVLLLQRHHSSRAFPGDFVFPGGTVDDLDCQLDPSLWHCSQLSTVADSFDRISHATVLGLLATAVRETFEEAGVLFARWRDGTPLSDADLASPTFIDARQRLNQRGKTWDWSDWLKREQLTLDLDALAPWAWWVTPVHRPHRFDTRFFIGHLPARQTAAHDGTETTSMRWTTPEQALDDCRNDRIRMRTPTRHSLKVLSNYRSARDAVAAARCGAVDLRRVQPRVIRDGGELRVTYAIDEPPQTMIP